MLSPPFPVSEPSLPLRLFLFEKIIWQFFFLNISHMNPNAMHLVNTVK